jgi:hypothetical protein
MILIISEFDRRCKTFPTIIILPIGNGLSMALTLGCHWRLAVFAAQDRDRE